MRVDIARVGGRTIAADTNIQPPSGAGIDIWFEADDTIEVGEVVMIDPDADDTSGHLVVTGTAANDHLAVGVYTGQGGTGTEVSPLDGTGQNGYPVSGRQALDGDPVQIRVYGVALALVNALTASPTAVTGVGLYVTGTAGQLEESASLDGVSPAHFTLLDTADTTAVDFLPVMVRCLGG